MANLTAFGIALRQLRIEKNLRIFDLAQMLHISSAMISAIETGRKPIPDGFISSISRALPLTAEQIRILRSAKARTAKVVVVEQLEPEKRELVAAFARRVDELPSDLLERLKKSVLKSCDDEIPFKRRRRGILVPPLARAELEGLAEKVRSVFCQPHEIPVPIMDILEFRLEKILPDFDFRIGFQEEMGGDEGRVIAGENKLILRNDVYDGACEGKTRHRFTACHELGHYLLHRQVTFARASSSEDPIFRDAEWQADTFAGCLMLSKRHRHSFVDEDEAAERCGMSPLAARVVLSNYKKAYD